MRIKSPKQSPPDKVKRCPGIRKYNKDKLIKWVNK